MLKSVIMSEKYPFEIPKEIPVPNPVTTAFHKRDVRKQITIPLVISILSIVAIVFLFINRNIGSAEVWAQISMIFLSLFSMVVAVVPIVLMIAFIIGMHNLLKNLPPYTRSVQDAVEKISEQVKTGAAVSIKPILKIQEFTTQMNNLFGSFSKKKD
jgi:hypothetical protein